MLAERARLNAARGVLFSYSGITFLGIWMHFATRFWMQQSVDWIYQGFTLSLCLSALISLLQLKTSLYKGMRTFSTTSLIFIGGLLIYELSRGGDYWVIVPMIYIGVFSVGLILGYRASSQYATFASFFLVATIWTGLHFTIVVALILLAYAAALPTKVVETLITESTAELSRLNVQLRAEIAERKRAQDNLQHHQEHLEDLVAERTTELAETNTHLQEEIEVRYHTEASLLQRTQELEVRNKELDAYAHTVAHDLKNPLTGIIGFSELLSSRQRRLSPEKLALYANILVQKSRQMDNIIDELLLLSSVRKEEIGSYPLDMVAIVQYAQQRLDTMIEQQQATVDLIMPSDWPTALGHAPWVEEVWAKYLSHAIKYGGTPPVVKIGACLLDNGMACFWIRDNGPGLTREEQARLFEMFARPDHTRHRGHGLGLSIVRRIVEKLGGEVQMESLVGQGSSFSFTLPTTS